MAGAMDRGRILFFRPVFLPIYFLVQFGAIWCNLVQSGAIPRDELQSGCGGIAPFFSELRHTFLTLPARERRWASL
jgi:hypothetical protein